MMELCRAFETEGGITLRKMLTRARPRVREMYERADGQPDRAGPVSWPLSERVFPVILPALHRAATRGSGGTAAGP